MNLKTSKFLIFLIALFCSPNAVFASQPSSLFKEFSCKGGKKVLLKVSKASPSKKSQNIVLIVHGLNLDPSKMMDIEKFILDSGSDTLTLALQGHRMDQTPALRLKNFKNVTADIWKSEVLCAYENAMKLDYASRIHFLGYSLGGLLGASLINNKKIGPESVVLISPAISLYPVFYLTRLVSFLPKLTYPSMAPKAYRANTKTPLASYNAIYDLLQDLKPFNPDNFSMAISLILAEEDELIDNEGIEQDFIKKHGLNWKILKVSPLKKNDLPRHLNMVQENLSHKDIQAIRSLVSTTMGKASSSF